MRRKKSNGIIVLFLGAYVIMKRRHPEKQWIYGRSWILAACYCIPPLLGTGFAVFYSLKTDDPFHSIPRFNLVSSCIVIGWGFLVHILVRCCRLKPNTSPDNRGSYGMLKTISAESMEEEPLPPVHIICSAADNDGTDYSAISSAIIDDGVRMGSVALRKAVHEDTDVAEQESVL